VSEEYFDNGEDIVEGTVERVIFAAPEGTFSVISVKSREGGRVTVTLNSAPPNVGEDARFSGKFVIHPRFGEQLKATNMELIRPTDAAGVERFLASGIIEGIRARFAKRIVERFGADAIYIIEHSPERLMEIPGIGKSKIKKIKDSFIKNSELRDIMLWLETHGVSGMLAARIFKRYASFSVEMLENHPYQLAYDVKGIGFITADTIARSIGVDSEDEERVMAGINYALNDLSSSGHTCAPVPYLIEEAAKILRIDNNNLIDQVITDMVNNELLVSEESGGETYIYNKYLYAAEMTVSERIKEIQKYAEILRVRNVNSFIASWEQYGNIKLASKQKDAVRFAVDSGVFVLTGGPGTGKTTVVRAIIALLDKLGCKILLGAPTGRAAKRLSETTGRHAKTVHRLLEAQGVPGEDFEFGRNAENPLEADVIILDEVSMMDINLMRHFLLAVPDGAHIILVGDVDQLPAIGPGLVLKDIIASKVGNSVALNEIFRQAGESGIVIAAHQINRGKIPNSKNMKDFVFIPRDSGEEVAELIEEIVVEGVNKFDYSPLTDIQVLSPMHKDVCGTIKLNARLQNALNPPSIGKNERPYGSVVFREGDKVMQTKNNYEKKVFNGDIGFISEINGEEITVTFDNEITATYSKDEIADLTLAYAMSVHKSQGSEYPVIIMPMVKAHYVMLQRNLLYTAVTRAKNFVVLIGDESAYKYAVKNDRTKKRYTLLRERLMGII